MFRIAAGLSALALFALASCTPYPVYNSSASTEEEADVTTAGRRPSTEEVVSTPIPSATTIDARLFGRIVDTYVGTPYAHGGDDLHGIDCSNLVAAIYRDYDGTDVPANTRGLYRLPDVVEEADLQVGDLVFFNFSTMRSPSHVGIYLGKDRFVHASETKGVIVSSIDDAAYHDAYRGARRVAPQLHSGE